MNDKIKLKDACKILNGFAFKSSKYVDSGIRIIRITNVQKGYVEDERPAFYPNSEESTIRDYMLEENDLLLSLTGNVGRVALLDKRWLPAALNQRVACLRIKGDRIIKYYLYFALLSDKFENDCIKSSKGIAQKNMSTEWLKDYEIPLPSVQKQREIVSLLKQLSMIIKNKIEQIQQLDDLIKARFVEMFGDRFLNTMNWPTKKLGECATFRNGKAHEKVISETGQYVLITSRAIASDLQDVRRTDSLLTPLATGDIVMVMSDVPNGKALAKCLLITENEKYTLNQRICSLSNYDLNPVFFTYLLNRHQFFLSFNDGNGQTNLRKDDILNCPLIRPSIELQNQFANFVAQVDKSKFTLSNKLAMCNFYVRLVYDRIMHGRIDL